MTGRISGLLLDEADAIATREALEVFAAMLAENNRRPSAKLAALMAKFPKNVADASLSGRNAASNARNVGGELNSGEDRFYALLDTGQVAEILGLTPNGVRDRARRGTIPSRRAGGRWVYPADAIVGLTRR